MLGEEIECHVVGTLHNACVLLSQIETREFPRQTPEQKDVSTNYSQGTRSQMSSTHRPTDGWEEQDDACSDVAYSEKECHCKLNGNCKVYA